MFWKWAFNINVKYKAHTHTYTSLNSYIQRVCPWNSHFAKHYAYPNVDAVAQIMFKNSL